MTSTARAIDRTELPAPGTWRIDPGHAEVAFVGRHFGLTRIRGRFTGVNGTLKMTGDPADAALSVKIDMATVESGNPDRDDHLRSADFFDVVDHPFATFVATRIERRGATGTVVGELDIKGVGRTVALDVEYLGHAHDPWGDERIAFTASATIDREDWGLTWNMILDTGGLVVSKEIRLEIEVELVREPS